MYVSLLNWVRIVIPKAVVVSTAPIHSFRRRPYLKGVVSPSRGTHKLA